MLERILLVVFLAAGSIALFHLIRLVHVRRMPTIAVKSGMPTLLYFRSDTCSTCRAQSHYIDRLSGNWNGRLTVETIDADRDRAMTTRFGVLTLPMTIWLDQSGQATQVNYGLADAGKLERQLIGLLQVPTSSQTL